MGRTVALRQIRWGDTPGKRRGVTVRVYARSRHTWSNLSWEPFNLLCMKKVH